MVTKRISYFDMLRGIAIIFVIGNHCFDNIPPGKSIYGDLMLLMRQIISCAVPLFLAISGFFMAGKTFKNKKTFFESFRKHSVAIYLPMIVWSMPFFLLDIRDGNVIFKLFLMLLGGYSVYYFIVLIIQYYAMAYLLNKIKWRLVLSFILTVFSVGSTSYLRMKGYNLNLVVTQGIFVSWLIFPVLGGYIRKIKRTYSANMLIMLCIFSLIICWIEISYMYNSYGKIIFDSKVSTILFVSCLIPLLFRDEMIYGYDKIRGFCKIKKYTEWLGKNSLGIYFVHPYTLIVINSVFGIHFF